MQPMPRDLDDILEQYPEDPKHLIALLQDVQQEFGYITPEAMTRICDHVWVPLSRAYSVATFYKSFSLEPRGEHEVKVCLGTACHLKGGERLVETLEHELGVGPGETTADLSCTVETVHCLGACALAPVVVIDDSYHAVMDSSKLKKVIKKTFNSKGAQE